LGVCCFGVVVEVDVSKRCQSQALARNSLSLQWLNREEVVGIEKKKKGMSANPHIFMSIGTPQIMDDTPLRPLTWRTRRGMHSRIV
jgi:hypothetical protein